MNKERADDLNEDSSLPQPGTKEPKEPKSSEETDGPGNVSVDEPTQPVLDPDEDDFGKDET